MFYSSKNPENKKKCFVSTKSDYSKISEFLIGVMLLKIHLNKSQFINCNNSRFNISSSRFWWALLSWISCNTK